MHSVRLDGKHFRNSHALLARSVLLTCVTGSAACLRFWKKDAYPMNAPKLRRNPFSISATLCALASLAALGACDSATTGANNSCPVGEKRCACFSNETCAIGLVCISDTCVEPGAPGAGGNSSVPTDTTTANNTTTAASSQPSDGMGGSTQSPTNTNPVTNSGGSGNDVITTSSSNGGGNNPTTTAADSGGAPQTTAGQTSDTMSTGGASNPASTSTANSGGTPQTTANATTAATTTPVNNSPIIDAFASCDEAIEANGGRHGNWYYFADEDFNATHGYGDPGTKWKDHGCAAWMILGCTGTACNYAGLGFQLAGGDPANLSSFTGVSIALEAGNDVYFVVKTSDGGYFGEWLSATTGNQTRNVDFAGLAKMADSAVSSLDTRLITEMQFTIGKTIDIDAGFGMAIHAVSLR